MTTSVQAGTFLVLNTENTDIARAPVDVDVISESITIVLAPREDPPLAELRALWFSWLSGHLRLLMPLALAHRRALPDTETLAATRRALENGLPEDGAAACVRLQELARTCRYFLGLALEEPGAGQGPAA